MKKLLVFAIATMFAFSVSAQTFGVKAGMNMSAYKVNFWTPDGAKMGMGMNLAVLGEMPITELISLRADLGFNQLGSDYDSRDEVDADWGLRAAGVEYDKATNVNYIKLGITPKFSFGPAYAFIGPYFAYAVNSKETGTWEGDYLYTPAPGTGSFDIFSDANTSFNPAEAYSDDNNGGGSGDYFNKLDLGLNLGFGANFSGVFVELSAGLGMMNFINTESDSYVQAGFTTSDDKTVALTDDASQKNLFFGLSVGYMLGGE